MRPSMSSAYSSWGGPATQQWQTVNDMPKPAPAPSPVAAPKPAPAPAPATPAPQQPYDPMWVGKDIATGDASHVQEQAQAERDYLDKSPMAQDPFWHAFYTLSLPTTHGR